MSSDLFGAIIAHNLHILPEAIMCGVIVLTVLLASPSLAVLTAELAATQLLARGIGGIMIRMDPEVAVVTSSMSPCHGGLINKTWDRLLRGTAAPELLWHPKAPTAFMTTVSFFLGYAAALRQLYKDEINAGVISASWMTGSLILMALVVLLALVYRVMSGCETILGALVGVGLGLVVGYLGTVTVGYMSDRRMTNIWGIPLLRDRINAGSPIYVCS
jgi:hypothetical protein